VLTARLNVRSGPGLTNNILTVIGYGETYPIVGRNADGSWWQLNVNGVTGWVSGALIAVNNEQAVPITT
jgi:N-acetylmuramoyl-L-alanine amidase